MSHGFPPDDFAAWLWLAAALAWLFSPLILLVLAVSACIRKRASSNRARLSLAVPAIVVASASWAIFLSLLAKAQTPYGDIFQTSALTHSLLLLCVLGVPAAFFVPNCRWRLLLANLLLITLWVGVGYAPSHFLRRWDDGDVTINGRPTSASIFIAHPWDSEAESMVLVRTGVVPDFFLNFAAETVHVEPKHPYVRVPGGVWTLYSLREMKFEQPLASNRVNELRFNTRNGSVVSVQF